MTSATLTDRGLWALDPAENDPPDLKLAGPPHRYHQVPPPGRAAEAVPEDFPYAFGVLDPVAPLDVLPKRRLSGNARRNICDSCRAARPTLIVFARDCPSRPRHWSAVYLVCDRCAPPGDPTVPWAPWPKGGDSDP